MGAAMPLCSSMGAVSMWASSHKLLSINDCRSCVPPSTTRLCTLRWRSASMSCSIDDFSVDSAMAFSLSNELFRPNSKVAVEPSNRAE